MEALFGSSRFNGFMDEEGVNTELQVFSTNSYEFGKGMNKGRQFQNPLLIENGGFNCDDLNEDNNSQAPLVAQNANHPMQEGSSTYVEPECGAEFHSEEHAYSCYSRYAVLQGFSIRKGNVTRSSVNGSVASRRYNCFRNGCSRSNSKKPRGETRTGCLAHMTISRQASGSFRVSVFEREHNHELVTSHTADKLPLLERSTFSQTAETESDGAHAWNGFPRIGMISDSEVAFSETKYNHEVPASCTYDELPLLKTLNYSQAAEMEPAGTYVWNGFPRSGMASDSEFTFSATTYNNYELPTSCTNDELPTSCTNDELPTSCTNDELPLLKILNFSQTAEPASPDTPVWNAFPKLGMTSDSEVTFSGTKYNHELLTSCTMGNDLSSPKSLNFSQTAVADSANAPRLHGFPKLGMTFNTELTLSEIEHNHELVSSSKAWEPPSPKRLAFCQTVEDETANTSLLDGFPRLGMTFDTEEDAYNFYKAYAGHVGFSVRRDCANVSKIDGLVACRRFTCFREGFSRKREQVGILKRPRKEIRTGCLAQLVIARQPDSIYCVTHFEEKHNHELVSASRSRKVQSQKKLADVQGIEANMINFSMLPLGCQPPNGLGLLTHSPVDYKCSLPSRRSREIRVGEAESILHYFESKQLKDSSFFYAVQFDAYEQLTNIFWADAKMKLDYSDFGDVVCFDTTYRLKDCLPFAPFIGVNNHKQMIIFGGALLYDDTVESFKWLFQTFIKAMSAKKPNTFLTDQCAVVAEAVHFVLPETHHRVCVWHVYQNALKHLSDAFLRLGAFVNDFCNCIFDHDEEDDFVTAWKSMLEKYELWDNVWLQELFRDRENWAIAYRRHMFCADVKNVLLFEGFHTDLRKFLKPDMDVLQFLKHLGRVLNARRKKELEASSMNQHLPRLMEDMILLKHARDMYTPKVFELFQQEHQQCLNVVVNRCSETGSWFEYRVSTPGEPREYKVILSVPENTVICSCLKFEFAGILCCHALKVFYHKNIKVLPDRYILKRWRRDARVRDDRLSLEWIKEG